SDTCRPVSPASLVGAVEHHIDPGGQILGNGLAQLARLDERRAGIRDKQLLGGNGKFVKNWIVLLQKTEVRAFHSDTPYPVDYAGFTAKKTILDADAPQRLGWTASRPDVV